MTKFTPASELLTEDALITRFNELVKKEADNLNFKVVILFRDDKDLYYFIKDRVAELERLGYKIQEHTWGAPHQVVVSW